MKLFTQFSHLRTRYSHFSPFFCCWIKLGCLAQLIIRTKKGRKKLAEIYFSQENKCGIKFVDGFVVCLDFFVAFNSANFGRFSDVFFFYICSSFCVSEEILLAKKSSLFLTLKGVFGFMVSIQFICFCIELHAFFD